jgi:hypothetical protein
MKITKEQAEIMLKKMPEMAEEIYKDFPELKASMVVDSWEDLPRIYGFFINDDSKIIECNLITNFVKEHKNVFKTKKQADSALAYAQLTQLMADCGDCDVDWSSTVNKYSIWRSESFLESISHCSVFHFLAFNTENIRDEFLHKHEALIKTFYQL